MVTIMIAGLVLILIGALPVWPYSREWGFSPSAGTAVVLVLVVLLRVKQYI